MISLTVFAGFGALKAAAKIVSIGWLATILVYFWLAPDGMNWGYTLIHFVQAWLFWRMSVSRLFPRPLFLLAGMAIVANFLATVIGFGFWWSAFALNRLFDLMLLYIAGCAMFRIWRLRKKQKGAPMARPHSAELLAAA